MWLADHFGSMPAAPSVYLKLAITHLRSLGQFNTFLTMNFNLLFRNAYESNHFAVPAVYF